MLRLMIIILTTFTVIGASATGYSFREGYGMTAAWLSGDKVGVYAENGTQIRFDIQNITSDTHKAYLNGHGTGLRSNTRYFSLYPYSYDYYLYDNLSTALPVAYPTLTQVGNDNANHIASSDFMASDVTTTSANAATFNYTHLGSVLRLNVKVPKTAAFVDATITTSRGMLMSTGILNLQTRTFTTQSQSASVNLHLSNVSVEKGQMLTVYFILPATNLSGGDVTASFTTTANETYSCSFSGMNIQAGCLYNIGRTLRLSDSKAKQGYTAAPDRQMSPVTKPAKVNGDLYNPTCIASDFTIALNDEQYDALPPDYIVGDANNDGKVNIIDVATIVAYMNGRNPSAFNFDAADTNKDGRINATDLTFVVNQTLNSGR